MNLTLPLIGLGAGRTVVTLDNGILTLVKAVGHQSNHPQHHDHPDTNPHKCHSLFTFHFSLLTSNPQALRSSQYFGYDLLTTWGLLITSPVRFIANGANASAIR